MNTGYFPEIETLFDFPKNSPIAHLYEEIISQTLVEVLPKTLWHTGLESDEILDQKQDLLSSLPRVWATPCLTAPGNMSFFVFSKFRPNAFKFFFEMICQWVIPGRRLNAIMIHAGDFRVRAIDGELFTLCEVMIHFDNQSELEEVHRNFPTIQAEVRLGMHSSFYGRRILEIRGVSTDSKVVLIQEEIAYLLAKRPKKFGYDLLNEMQHVLVMCRDEFKEKRDSHHLTRIIIVKYLFRKLLSEDIKIHPENRHLRLKIFKAVLHQPVADKSILAIVVGLNFLTPNEVFEERHLLGAIQNYIPSAKAVEGSFFANAHGTEKIRTFYLEIEKNHSEEFSHQEMQLLRKELPSDLKDRIEHLLHPIFMARNEEEIMRNILSLSNQIKYLHDLPQVIIIFDEQTQTNLLFTIIIVQVMREGTLPVQDQFKGKNSSYEYIHDRSRIVGYLRNKYAKEATVFRVKLPKKPFLRQNHSINLNMARQSVVQELTHVVGEVRDFNGGMISKQYELLCAVRDELSQVKYNELLLENFFYSLTPDVMRTVLPADVLSKLFLLLLDVIETDLFSGESHSIKTIIEAKGVYLLLKTKDRSIKELINRALNRSAISNSKLTNSFVQVYEMSYLGFYFQSDEEDKQQLFCQLIKEVVARRSLPKAQLKV